MEPAIDGSVVSVAQGVDEDFENVYDVPFVTVNRVDGQYIAEVVTSEHEDDVVTEARIQQALDWGHRNGLRSDEWGPGDLYNVMLIFFTPDVEDVAA
jgi:hypothetical protein